MSYKFDSLMTILNKLDRNEKVTVHSLMNDLEISERSVHRYLQTLQVARFPIHYDRKKERYCFVEGYSMKKPNLSIEESLAFALAKGTLGNVGSGMERSLSSIEEKLASRPRDISGQIVLKAQKPSPKIEDYVGRIYEAILNFQRIEISYRTPHSKEKTLRKVDPYYIFFPEGFWTLRAYCHLRKGMRTFALDRILSLKVLGEHFAPLQISAEEEISSSFGAWLDGKVVKVVLRFDTVCKPYVLRKKWHESQMVKELDDGRIEVVFKVNGLEEIKHWIYRWIPNVEVRAPKKLKDMIREELREALIKMDGTRK